MLILSSSYLSSIAHFALILQNKDFLIDGKEHFIKQSHRNRTLIYGANGPLSLSIPLQKYANHTPAEEMKISYTENWQTQHWRSFEAAYRNTAYFEFYVDDLKVFYEEPSIEKLIDFNTQLEELLLELLKIEANRGFTEDYQAQERDWRMLLSPKKNELNKASHFPVYQQVFSDQHGFKANLSIIDLLFNLGPASTQYLQEVKLSTELNK